MTRTFKHLPLLATLLAAAAFAAPGFAQGGEVIRHAGPPQSPILSGVTVPPGKTTLYLSGMVPPPIDASKPADSLDAYGDTKTQGLNTLKRIKETLESLGWSMKDVVKLTVFVVADPKSPDKRMDFAGWNAAYSQFFGSAENPNKVARSTVQVAGLAGPYFLVEVEAVAVR